MRRAGLVAVAGVLAAVAEIAAFVVMVKLIGLGWTLLLLLATSLAGSWLLRREGVRGWRRFRAALAVGRPPGREATDGLLGLVGALLLVLPGFLTDVAGALLLVPPTRGYARAGVQRAAERRISPAMAGDFFGPRRVRVRRGRAEPGPAQPRPSGATTAIEGEIIEPGRTAQSTGENHP
jgi:UPF0716 protein FxsA